VEQADGASQEGVSAASVRPVKGRTATGGYSRVASRTGDWPTTCAGPAGSACHPHPNRGTRWASEEGLRAAKGQVGLGTTTRFVTGPAGTATPCWLC